MGYKERPLPLRKAEMRLKLAEICIIQEWSRISLRLRLCLDIIRPKAKENWFELSLEAQVNEWSSALNKILVQADERRSLLSTVNQMNKALPVRNAIAHGEPGWIKDAPDSYILFYTYARSRTKPRKKQYSHSPPRLELFPNAFLEPADAELHSLEMDDMLTMAKGMKPLRLATQKLCDIAVARSQATRL